jgi:hypothetical protein
MPFFIVTGVKTSNLTGMADLNNRKEGVSIRPAGRVLYREDKT